MKQKGFSLIELLVVVAIIGILAAVGVVAYNGYTNAAKRAVTIANFHEIQDLMKTEFIRLCISNGEPLELKYPDGSWKEWSCSRIKGDMGGFTSALQSHLDYTDWKNPYDGKTISSTDVGGINMNEDMGYIYIRTRYKKNKGELTSEPDGDIKILENKKVNSSPFIIP